MQYLLAACLVVNGMGCSLYVNRPVTFHVRDAETKQPIQGAEIGTGYVIGMWDLGWFISPTWGPRSGVTDADGKVTLFFDPKKENAAVWANAKGFINQDHLRGEALLTRLTSQSGLMPKSDFYLDLQKEPDGRLDLIVPNGYRGSVVVHFASNDSSPKIGGPRRSTYELNQDGHVWIQDPGLFGPTEKYARLVARFRDGAEIPTVLDRYEAELKTDALALWLIGKIMNEHEWIYFVGTEGEAYVARHKLVADGQKFDDSAFPTNCSWLPLP
jgi:hypothetical protein